MDLPSPETSAAREHASASQRTELTEEPPAAPTRWTGAVFDVIEWRRFEAVCEALFGQAGFETKSQSHGADGGIEIWLYSKHQPDGPLSVVQCKHWSSKPVPVLQTRALLGSMTDTDKKVNRGILDADLPELWREDGSPQSKEGQHAVLGLRKLSRMHDDHQQLRPPPEAGASKECLLSYRDVTLLPAA